MRIPLYASLDPRLLPLETRVFEDTRILSNVLVSMDVTSLHPGGGGGGTQKRFIRGGSAPRSSILPLYTILNRIGILFDVDKAVKSDLTPRGYYVMSFAVF